MVYYKDFTFPRPPEEILGKFNSEQGEKAKMMKIVKEASEENVNGQ